MIPDISSYSPAVQEILKKRLEKERKERVKRFGVIRKGIEEHGIFGYRQILSKIKKSDSGDFGFRTAHIKKS